MRKLNCNQSNHLYHPYNSNLTQQQEQQQQQQKLSYSTLQDQQLHQQRHNLNIFQTETPTRLSQQQPQQQQQLQQLQFLTQFEQRQPTHNFNYHQQQQQQPQYQHPKQQKLLLTSTTTARATATAALSTTIAKPTKTKSYKKRIENINDNNKNDDAATTNTTNSSSVGSAIATQYTTNMSALSTATNFLQYHHNQLLQQNQQLQLQQHQQQQYAHHQQQQQQYHQQLQQQLNQQQQHYHHQQQQHSGQLNNINNNQLQQCNFNYMNYNNQLQQQQQQQLNQYNNCNTLQQQQQQLQQQQQQHLQMQLTSSPAAASSSSSLHQYPSFFNTEQMQQSQQQQQQPQQQQSQQLKSQQQFKQEEPYIIDDDDDEVTEKQRNDANNDVVNDNECDKITMDANEIANFLANELFMQQLASVDGIQSGVPTLTTSTLTPTTLRSIEDTILQLTTEQNIAPYQAGFVPPTFNSNSFNDNLTENDSESDESQESWIDRNKLIEENSQATTDTSSAATDSTSFQNGFNNQLATSNASSTNDFTFAIGGGDAKSNSNILKNLNANNTSTAIHGGTSGTSTAAGSTNRRNQGGRRPVKSTNMTPEEEEKRRLRRERNKLAAARCRKRRVDQTNELEDQVADLEKKRECLQKVIEDLKLSKTKLNHLLESHRPTCPKIRDNNLLNVNTFAGLIEPIVNSSAIPNNEDSNGTIIGIDTTLSSAGRSISPVDLKPILLDNGILHQIKSEPLDSALDSNSSLDHDGPSSSPTQYPMIRPQLPNVATLSPLLNTPVVTTAPTLFESFANRHTTLSMLNDNQQPQQQHHQQQQHQHLQSQHQHHHHQLQHQAQIKQRPNTLPSIPRNLTQSLALNIGGAGKTTDINGVAIQTPSTGLFNYNSLMEGGTGLTPDAGPIKPTCSSQNKHPLESITPTSEPSKLVSL